MPPVPPRLTGVRRLTSWLRATTTDYDPLVKFVDADVLRQPYASRRNIVVDVNRSIEEYFERASNGNAGGPRRKSEHSRQGAAGAAKAAVRKIVDSKDAAAQRWRDRKLEELAESDILPVTAKQARPLEFPAGHPLDNVVYVADPGVPGRYFPVSNFHRAMFDDKYSEAIRLLRSLGAERIVIEYLQGYEHAGGITFSASGIEGDPHGGMKKSSKRGIGATLVMELRPEGRARLPRDLFWYRSEPLWQEIAEARLEHRLQSFNLELRYSDDFGVNGELAARIKDIGLELGGDFRRFRETVWKIEGIFAER